MTNWDSDFESQTIEGQKVMLFQVIDKINLFRDKVEIHIDNTMDLFKEGLSEQMAEPISPIINDPMAIEGEVLPADSIVAEQSNYGVVNCVSLAVKYIKRNLFCVENQMLLWYNNCKQGINCICFG